MLPWQRCALHHVEEYFTSFKVSRHFALGIGEAPVLPQLQPAALVWLQLLESHAGILHGGALDCVCARPLCMQQHVSVCVCVCVPLKE